MTKKLPTRTIAEKRATHALLETAKTIQTLLKNEDLPADLSKRHDYYHYEEEPKKS